jgi:flagellin-like hook-associated protein FlgL
MPAISNARQHALSRQSINNRMAKMQENNEKVNTGKAVKDFSKLKSREIYALFNSYEISKSTATKTEIYSGVLEKIEATNRALERIKEVITAARRTVIQSERNPQKAQYIELIKQGLGNIEGELNTHVHGKYIFAGSHSDIKPVNGIRFDSNIRWDLKKLDFVPTANYYRGNDYLEKLEIFPGEVIEFGILANDPVFQEIIAGMNYIKDGLQDNNHAMLKQGMELLEKNDEGILVKISKLGQIGDRISENKELQENRHETAEMALQKITDADIIELAMERNQLSEAVQADISTANELKKMTESVINMLR